MIHCTIHRINAHVLASAILPQQEMADKNECAKVVSNFSSGFWLRCAFSDLCYSNWNYTLEIAPTREIFIETEKAEEDTSIFRTKKKRFFLVEHKAEHKKDREKSSGRRVTIAVEGTSYWKFLRCIFIFGRFHSFLLFSRFISSHMCLRAFLTSNRNENNSETRKTNAKDGYFVSRPFRRLDISKVRIYTKS